MNLYEPVNNHNKIRYRQINPHINRKIEVAQAELRQAYLQKPVSKQNIERRPFNKFVYAFVQLVSGPGTK